MTTCVDLYRSLASRRDFDAAAVSNFHHVPLSLDFDSNVTEKLIVETGHSKGNSGPIAYWLAAIVRKCGYLVELKWLGDHTNATFTRNFPCYKEPSPNDLDARLFPVGWALANNKLFEPPQEIREPPQGWRAFLEHKLHPKKGLDDNIYRVSQEENESCFKPGMLAEATDINRVNAISRVVVEDDIGRRLRLRYLSDANDRKICWFHDFSGELLPCGWAQIYGRELTPIPNQFNASMRAFVEAPMYDFKPFLIPDFVYDTLRSYRFEVGHKLELIDPLEPNFIRVGTIMKVMRNQYLLINIDGTEHDVCLHAFSPNLLPAGFAAKNGLLAHFQPPREDFSYKDSNVVPWRIFEKIIPRNTFKRNQFLEAVRVPGTNLLHIARIVRIVGHLVLVHFEGYPSSEDQFFPISSVDLYPVGWCHFVGHELQIPRGD